MNPSLLCIFFRTDLMSAIGRQGNNVREGRLHLAFQEGGLGDFFISAERLI